MSTCTCATPESRSAQKPLPHRAASICSTGVPCQHLHPPVLCCVAGLCCAVLCCWPVLWWGHTVSGILRVIMLAINHVVGKPPTESVLFEKYARIAVIIDEVINEVSRPPRQRSSGPSFYRSQVPMHHATLSSQLGDMRVCLARVVIYPVCVEASTGTHYRVHMEACWVTCCVSAGVLSWQGLLEAVDVEHIRKGAKGRVSR